MMGKNFAGLQARFQEKMNTASGVQKPHQVVEENHVDVENHVNVENHVDVENHVNVENHVVVVVVKMITKIPLK